MDNKNKKKDKEFLVLEEKIIVFFCILAGILSLLAIFVTVADVVNRNTNNNISAYAVEEDHDISTSLPCDVVKTGTGSMYAFNSYNYSTDLYVTDVHSLAVYTTFKVNYSNGNYYLSFDNTNIYSNLFIIKCTYEDYATGSLTFSDIASLSAIDGYDGQTSTYFLNLSQMEYSDFGIAYVQGSVVTPLLFIQDLVLGEQDLAQVVYYNTNSFYTSYYSSTYSTCVLNLIDYQYFKFYSVSPNTSWVSSINGFYNNNPARYVREFVFTAELMWEEGYNNGYEAGYEEGYNTGVSATAINPFQDKYMIDARLYNSAWSSHVDISDYAVGTGNVYSYGDFSINTNTVFASALNSAYTSNPSYSNLELQFPAIYEYSPIACNLLNVLYVGYKYQDNWIYSNVDVVNVYIVLERLIGSSDPSDMVELSFTFIPNVELKIEFNNLNGIDYSAWFFSNLRVRMSLNSDILSSDKVFGINLPDGLYGTYTDGYKQGYREGMSVGNKGFLSGYNQGYADAVRQNQYTFFSLIGAVIDAPIQYFTSLFDYEILGTNIKGFLLALLTIGIALAVIRVSLGKK